MSVNFHYRKAFNQVDEIVDEIVAKKLQISVKKIAVFSSYRSRTKVLKLRACRSHLAEPFGFDHRKIGNLYAEKKTFFDHFCQQKVAEIVAKIVVNLVENFHN